jgi:hypothetical protein
MIEGIGLYELFSSREAFEIQHADLSIAREVFRRARERVCRIGASVGPPTIAAIQFALASNRPTATLSRQNRSWIEPQFSPVWLDDYWSSLVSPEEAESTASPDTRLATRRYITLPRDLAPNGKCESHFDEAGRSDASACFWRCYRQGRTSYESSFTPIALKEICVGFFNEKELGQLLPDLILPRLHRRAAYLTNLLWDLGRLCLDLFCARTLRPLCRHYFTSEKSLPVPLPLAVVAG